MKKLINDLLYQNGVLNIAMVSSLIANILYWIVAGYGVSQGGVINFLELGGGWAAIASGSAGWIYWHGKGNGNA
jgi:hypothetical protein